MAETSYTIKPIKLKIKRDPANTNVTNEKTKVVIGERIQLRAELENSTNPISNPQWTLPAKTIKQFLVTPVTQAIGAPVPPTTNATTTDFVIYEEGTNLEAVFKCKVNNIDYQAKAIFTAVAPVANIATPYPPGNIEVTTTCYPEIRVTFGCNKVPPGTDVCPSVGILLDPTVTPPHGYTGTFEWVQVWDRYRKATYFSGCTMTLDDVGLDSQFPYGFSSCRVNGVFRDKLFIDTPDQALCASPIPAPCTDVSHAEVHDSFCLYLLWKPNVANAEYVVLKRIDWGWSADPVYSQATGTWSLGLGTASSGPFILDVHDYPVWNKRLSKNDPFVRMNCRRSSFAGLTPPLDRWLGSPSRGKGAGDETLDRAIDGSLR